MYGPGAPPPTSNAGTVITLRVLIAAAGFLSCGLFACLPLFRVAFLRGRWFNWVAAWVSLPLSITCFAVVGAVAENNVKGDYALGTVMILGALSSAYFLVMDIRQDNPQRQYAGYAPDRAATVPPGYGYPPPSPYANMRTGPQQPPMPHTPIPQPQDQVPRPPAAQSSVPTPPQRPAPARIDQVRAELDELSDYLRKHDSNGSGNGTPNPNPNSSHEGGR
ncbi:conjugal transfer protein TraF [Streptomyces sp. SID12501]|uniref:Conjugal transfer protein TraF n=1 Tax=Streptomyces sp. SID12501 TaxID=2706042 RepID=A0A6B3BYU9_9ACTN|nr:conjugal transfer protein TraF [Streptomyces sp. SID12501]NEC89613.1 conjugal transfer protein TraF [Streptomyces sp. SID12501]